MRRWLSIIALLLPLAGFVACLGEVRCLIDGGMTVYGLLLMFAALAIMTAVEALLFKYWVLPGWGRAISERLYEGTYTPDQDPLVSLAAHIRREKDVSRLPELARLVQRDASRMRGWQELANLQLEECGDAAAAVHTLLEGAARVSPKEDRAYLMYRAAHLCEQRLHDAPRAAELYAQTARRFPRTTYGKKAAGL
ncbi:MAG: hypothetical protein IKV82_08195 [Akkermansia sp.]|nr:hypothetical protein [Akkermansia sp.]